MGYASKGILGFFILLFVYAIVGHLWFPRSRYRAKTNNIQALTVDQANALMQEAGRGYELELNGLTSISVEVAKVLARHEGSLYLNGLTTLSDEAAKALSQHRGDVTLYGVTELSDKAMEVFRSAQSNASGTKPSFNFSTKFRQ